MIKYLVFDTETTGLNIVTDKPFLLPYCTVDEKLNMIEEYMFNPMDPNAINIFIELLKIVPTLVGANLKFDINMCINAGVPIELFTNKNFVDIQVLARLVIPHDQQKDKTFSIALKKLGLRYLGSASADEERRLKAEFGRLIHEHKMAMKDYFVVKGVWPVMKQTEETTLINKVYKQWHKYYHLYPHLAKARKEFLTKHREPNYSDISNIETYAMFDVKLTYGLFKLWFPEIKRLQQLDTLLRISKSTIPLVSMERNGVVVDLQRILRDRAEIIKEQAKTKIIDTRDNTILTVGQHAKLKELYEYESGKSLDSADKAARAEVEDVSQAARTASYLSGMAKMLNTYITGMLKRITLVDGEYKAFTQYNQAGTITGRLSSDFQQFPKHPLVLNNGYEIDIRAWFITPKKYKHMFYFDYSQMELRLQCEWTNIILGTPDENMARAFSPYKCFTYRNGVAVPFNNDPDWKKVDWYLNEDPKTLWEPTDLHSLTTKNAFPGIDESHPDWKDYRTLGKRTNFAVNYGASAPKIASALNVDMKTARALVAGYKEAFKGVVAFGKWLQKRCYTTRSIPNLLFRRYYSRNKHLMQNWLVQGSGADILLEKIYEVWAYIQDKPHWELFLSVHDEIGLYCEDIPKKQLANEVEEIKNIMTYKMSAVDITVDVEHSTTNWAAKEDW